MNVENNCAITIATLGDWLENSHQFYCTTNEKKTKTLSAYHLNGISRGIFCKMERHYFSPRNRIGLSRTM